MDATTFSLLLLEIFIVVVLVNVVVNARKHSHDSPEKPDNSSIFSEYLGEDDNRSRFARELDLIPLAIIKSELPSHREKGGKVSPKAAKHISRKKSQ